MDVELKAELVLRCVEAVPEGALTTYGDVARLVGTGPRQVGRIMAVYGSSVPWWRITNAKGELPSHLTHDAVGHWDEEGITHARGAARLREHHMPLPELEVAWRERIADLPE